jgi:hypothetical protein
VIFGAGVATPLFGDNNKREKCQKNKLGESLNRASREKPGILNQKSTPQGVLHQMLPITTGLEAFDGGTRHQSFK